MSNWISSKLKAAETILQQIDQQAAESLKNNDATSSPSSSSPTNHTAVHGGDHIHSRKLDPSPSLKFQLPSKKTTPPSPLLTPPDIPTPKSRTSTSDPSVIDWTVLLSSPNPKVNIKKKVIKKPVVIPIKEEEVIQESVVEKEEEGKGDVGSGSSSSSESGSDSEYDSEEERRKRKERREEMIAEKAKEAAVKAIKEREDLVARLEGEKESLEKILEERAKQQAQEASELQMNMMETMEAVDLEKEKHHSTRMEAFARVAKLEV